MALDLEGRRRAKCGWRDCPYPAKVIDLTAGQFVEDPTADKAFHQACYEAKQGAQAERADRRQKRLADEALDKEYADAVAAQRLAADVAAWQARKDAWDADASHAGRPFPDPKPGSTPAAVTADGDHAGPPPMGNAIPTNVWKAGDAKPANATAVPVPSATPVNR
jgi:hypothetical protein